MRADSAQPGPNKQLAAFASIPASHASDLRQEIPNLAEDLRNQKRVREVDYS